MKCASLSTAKETPYGGQIREFMRTVRAFNAALRPPQGENAPRPQAFFALHFLHHQHAHGKKLVRLSDLGADLHLAPPAISLILNDLEKNGYVERVRDKEDRRVVRVRLTDSGAQVLEPMFLAARKQVGYIIDCLGAEDTENLLSLMKRAAACAQESRNIDA